VIVSLILRCGFAAPQCGKPMAFRSRFHLRCPRLGRRRSLLVTKGFPVRHSLTALL
jgi:hypothetical protein